jgi:uncharacterized OsmC-like protein
MTNLVNGVNVDQMLDMVSSIERDLAQAKSTWKAKTTWKGGGYVETQIRELTLEGDEPDELFGTNRAPNAIEAVLHALGACLAVGVAYHAAAREIIINAMELDVTGELDTRVFARQAGNRHRRGRSYG